MSKSKYTNTANAGRLRRRGQSVPKNLLTSEDRFIDGTCKRKLSETLKALAFNETPNVRQRFQRFSPFRFATQGGSNPGLELANAFGVLHGTQTDTVPE